MACLARVQPSIEDPLLYHNQNVNGLEITNFKKNDSIDIIGVGFMGLLFVGIAKMMKVFF